MFPITSNINEPERFPQTPTSVPTVARIDPVLSVYFDICRFCAAMVVFIGHYSTVMFDAEEGWLPGSDAVILFFVLSGYVIAYVSDRPDINARRYALDRLSRLWSVVIPAAIVAFLAWALFYFFRNVPIEIQKYNFIIFFRDLFINIAFLGESWFGEIYSPLNGPSWSINYEGWYYAIFGIFFFLKGKKNMFLQ